MHQRVRRLSVVFALLLVVLVALPPATRPLVAAPATVSPPLS